MKKAVLFTLLHMIAAIALGQMVEYRVHVYNKVKGKEVNAAGIVLCTFLSKGDAEQAMTKYRESYGAYEFSRKDGILSRGETGADGIADIQGNPNGYLWIDASMIIGDENGTRLVKIADLKPRQGENGIQWNIKYVLDSESPKATSDERDGVTVMDEKTIVEAKYLNLAEPQMRARRHGRFADFLATVPIDSAYARDDARFVAKTFLVDPTKNNDTIQMLSPYVVQGIIYTESMDRRMGYNAPKHDFLFPYIKKDQVMLKRKSDIVEMKYRVEVDPSRKLNAMTHSWYEDFNNVYHNRCDIVWDGNFEEPNRYLDWSGALIDSDLPTEHYERIGRADIHKGGGQYMIKFKSGSAEIDLEDSLTAIEVNRLREDVRRLYENHDTENYLAQDTIRGFASPEGGTLLNKELSRKRANALSLLVRQEFPDFNRLPPTAVDSEVVPWATVADTLEAQGDTMALEVARQLRHILAKVPASRQESEIVHSSWYKDYLTEKILPLLRRVEFSYISVTKRVRSRDEIIDMYNTNEDYHNGLIGRDYEYYTLLNHLYQMQDWTGLMKIAKQAMSFSDLMSIATRIDTLPRTHPDSLRLSRPSAPFSRPYPLAAYYYAKSCLKLGIVDTITLKPYYDFGGGMHPYQTRNQQSSKTNPEGWMNEEAILLTQASMYALADDYTSAYYLYDLYLSLYGEKYKKLGAFLKCLNGEYESPDVRYVVEHSTPMNYAMINLCRGTREGYRKALNVLNGNISDEDLLESWGKNHLENNDARVPYLKAICSFLLLAPQPLQRKSANYIPSMYLYQPDDEEQCWAAVMLEALRMDSNSIEVFKKDGYFNNAYRQLILYFWTRIQKGDTMEEIQKDYDALVKKYYPTMTE